MTIKQMVHLVHLWVSGMHQGTEVVRQHEVRCEMAF